MPQASFLWTCRFCHAKSKIACPAGITKQVRQYLAEMGCYFCPYTVYLQLITASHPPRLALDRLSQWQAQSGDNPDF